MYEVFHYNNIFFIYANSAILFGKSAGVCISKSGFNLSEVGINRQYSRHVFNISNKKFYSDTINFSSYKKAYFEKDSFTDGDLSEIIVYYLNSDTVVSVLNLQGRDMINSTGRIEFQPPKDKRNYFLRMKLYSSVCTGQLFHLKLRDVKIYGEK